VADEEYESEHDENWKRENAKLIEEDDWMVLPFLMLYVFCRYFDTPMNSLLSSNDDEITKLMTLRS
jgi:hypothetical protein